MTSGINFKTLRDQWTGRAKKAESSASQLPSSGRGELHCSPKRLSTERPTSLPIASFAKTSLSSSDRTQMGLDELPSSLAICRLAMERLGSSIWHSTLNEKTLRDRSIDAVLREMKMLRERRLENVGQEMMAPMISLSGRIVIVPLAIVNWDLHFCRISMVETIATAIILVPIEVLWVVHVWIVIESLVIAIAGCSTPCFTIRLSLRLSLLGLGVVVRCQTSDEC